MLWNFVQVYIYLLKIGCKWNCFNNFDSFFILMCRCVVQFVNNLLWLENVGVIFMNIRSFIIFLIVCLKISGVEFSQVQIYSLSIIFICVYVKLNLQYEVGNICLVGLYWFNKCLIN